MSGKILVVNMNYLGDALMTTPALAQLRNMHPETRIDTIAGIGPAADVLCGNPDINNVYIRSARSSTARTIQLYKLLRSEQYTDVVILPPLPVYAFAAWCARTPRRIGEAGRGMDRFLTHPRQIDTVHMSDKMMQTVCFNVPADTKVTPSLSQSDDVRREVNELLRAHGINPSGGFMVINAGATRPQKRWPVELFARTIDSLPNIPSVLIGHGDAENKSASTILRLTKLTKPINLVGKTTIAQLSALLGLATVLITGDSGPMHLAVACGTPTVALFGSTDPAVTGPAGSDSIVLYNKLACSPCNNHPTCQGRFDCMRNISPDDVVFAVRKILRRSGNSLVVLSGTEKV